MLKLILSSAIRTGISASTHVTHRMVNLCLEQRTFSSFISLSKRFLPRQPMIVAGCKDIFVPPQPLHSQQLRSLTKFSLIKGKRKSVKPVIKRFKRLDWGVWIRTHSGRHKKLFKKSLALKRRLRQHIFTNATQSMLLDKMVTKFWRKPKYYVDDPYAPYHKRNEFVITKKNEFKV